MLQTLQTKETEQRDCGHPITQSTKPFVKDEDIMMPKPLNLVSVVTDSNEQQVTGAVAIESAIPSSSEIVAQNPQSVKENDDDEKASLEDTMIVPNPTDVLL